MSLPAHHSVTPSAADGQQPPLRRIPVTDLLVGADQVILLHQGQEYHLRLTRAGKLILTK